MKFLSSWRIPLVAIAILIAVTGRNARGQTDESMVLKPWGEGKALENDTDLRLFQAGMTQVESAGRYRFITKYPIGPTVGYQYNLVAPHGGKFPFDNSYTDLSIGAGSPLGQIGQRSFWGGSIGAGYAGEAAFSNNDGWYGKGSIMAGGEIDKDSGWLLLVDYDGNRMIYPDAPQPGFVYSSKFGQNLDYVIGSGIAGMTWKPMEGLKLDAYWQYPTSLNVSIEYAISKEWTIFTAYTDREIAFHTSALPGNQRLIYAEQRLEVGAKWKVGEAVSLIVAGGYGMGCEFRQGFDYRHERGIEGLPDQPYVRAGLSINF